MADDRFPELLLVQTLEGGEKPFTAVYEINRTGGIAKMSVIQTDRKNEVNLSHTEFYPTLPKTDKEILADLYRGLMYGGRE